MLGRCVGEPERKLVVTLAKKLEQGLQLAGADLSADAAGGIRKEFEAGTLDNELRMTVDVEAQAHFWTFLKRAREVAEDAEEASLFEKARASAAELEKKVVVSGEEITEMQRELIHEKTVLRIELYGRDPAHREVFARARAAWAASEGRRLVQIREARDNLPPRVHCFTGGGPDDVFLGPLTLARKLVEVDLVVTLDLTDASADDVMTAVDKIGSAGVVFVFSGEEGFNGRGRRSRRVAAQDGRFGFASRVLFLRWRAVV